MGSERKEKKALSTFINDRFLIHLDEIKLFIDGKAVQLGVVTGPPRTWSTSSSTLVDQAAPPQGERTHSTDLPKSSVYLLHTMCRNRRTS
jgi:hypothetical protein